MAEKTRAPPPAVAQRNGIVGPDREEGDDDVVLDNMGEEDSGLRVVVHDDGDNDAAAAAAAADERERDWDEGDDAIDTAMLLRERAAAAVLTGKGHYITPSPPQ